jgi:hypothetical protein
MECHACGEIVKKWTEKRAEELERKLDALERRR